MYFGIMNLELSTVQVHVAKKETAATWQMISENLLGFFKFPFSSSFLLLDAAHAGFIQLKNFYTILINVEYFAMSAAECYLKNPTVVHFFRFQIFFFCTKSNF